MKAYYNRKIKVREKAVVFRTAKAAFCLAQNTLYDMTENEKDVVYLDFESDEQIDKVINTLQELKRITHEKESENNLTEDCVDEDKAES